jgi:hypothetical protein
MPTCAQPVLTLLFLSTSGRRACWPHGGTEGRSAASIAELSRFRSRRRLRPCDTLIDAIRLAPLTRGDGERGSRGSAAGYFEVPTWR